MAEGRRAAVDGRSAWAAMDCHAAGMAVDGCTVGAAAESRAATVGPVPGQCTRTAGTFGDFVVARSRMGALATGTMAAGDVVVARRGVGRGFLGSDRSRKTALRARVTGRSGRVDCRAVGSASDVGALGAPLPLFLVVVAG